MIALAGKSASSAPVSQCVANGLAQLAQPSPIVTTGWRFRARPTARGMTARVQKFPQWQIKILRYRI